MIGVNAQRYGNLDRRVAVLRAFSLFSGLFGFLGKVFPLFSGR